MDQGNTRVGCGVERGPKTPADSTSRELPKPKLLDEVHARIRWLNYSIRTEEAYVDWVRRFVFFLWQTVSAWQGHCSGLSRLPHLA
ncbi:MAG: phage integrase N-terminal SAM-like domain-containing protein [Pseudomonadota bacterium]|jgi:hypothetical protein